MKNLFQSKKLQNILLPIIFILLGNLFILNFKLHEKYIYYWDISGYWISCMDFTKLLFEDFSQAMSKLYASILHEDYTLLPVLFYAPVFRFISQSNTAFVLTTYNLFGVPFLLVCYILFIKQLDIRGFKGKTLILLILFTFTVFLTPIMGGYLDVAGLMVAGLILLLVQGWAMERIDIPKCLVLAVLTLILCFLRRWYSFWIVSFYICLFLSRMYWNKDLGWINKNTVYTFWNLFISGFVWLLILFVFFREFLVNALTNNFSFAYSAYDFGGMGYNLSFIISQSGLLMVALCIAGIVLSLVNKKPIDLTLFLLLQSILILVLFTRVQSLGVQHLYLFVPAFLYFIVYAAVEISNLFTNRKRLMITCNMLIFGLFILNFYNSYFKHDNLLIRAIDPILSQKKLYRRERQDIDEIHALVDYINEISRGVKYTYVLASSGTLNCDILKNAYLPDKKYAVNNLLYTLDVDKRDGFPNSFYAADIIVVAEPVQYHLAVENQQIVDFPAQAILEGRAGNSLQLSKTFTLQENTMVYIYERKESYSHDFINYIDKWFKKLYPEFDFLNDTISMYSYIYDLKLQEGKNIFLTGKQEMGFEIGQEAAGFKVNLEKSFNIVSFKMTANYDILPGKRIEISDERGNILFSEEIENGNSNISVNVDQLEYIQIQFTDMSVGLTDIYVSFSDFSCKCLQ